MEPFHPRLRAALLREPEHRKRKLTPALLKSYEAMVTKLFDLVHYPPSTVGLKADSGSPNQNGSPRTKVVDPAQLRTDIKKFQDEYMPNFKAVHSEWARNQKRALTGKHYSIPLPSFLTKFWQAVFVGVKGRKTPTKPGSPPK